MRELLTVLLICLAVTIGGLAFIGVIAALVGWWSAVLSFIVYGWFCVRLADEL